jgi:hypothetical protein
MTTQIKRRRGTTAEHASFTGAEGELTIDTTKDTVVVHDGATAGGYPLAKENGSTFTNVDINSGTIDGVTIGGASAGAITGTTITGTSFVTSGNMTFGDNDKAIFGAGSDLQIYHNGSHSIIADAGTGHLKLLAADLRINNAADTETFIAAYENSKVDIYHNNSVKLATTATGIDVTGTVTADGLTVAQSSGANILLESTTTGATTGDIFGEIEFKTNDASSPGIKAKIDAYSEGGVGNTALRLFTGDTTGLYQRLNIASNGDISFYEDTGTTPKLFWDASTERLGLGTTTPAANIHIEQSGTNPYLRVTETGNTGIDFGQETNGNGLINLRDSAALRIFTAATERMRIDSSGNVGIGNSTPSNNHANANNLVVGNGTAGGIANYVGTGLGWYAFSRDNANNSDAFDGGISYDGSRNLMFHTNAGSERMRIDSSGNVGIGNTSSGYVLTSGETRLTVGNGAEHSAIQLYSGTGKWGAIAFSDDTANEAGQGFIGYYHPDNYMQFNTNGTERLRINSSGSVGIGTIPNAGMTALTALQLGYGGGFQSHASSTNSIYVLSNAYYDGAWKYKNAGAATEYKGINGEHIWETAASGSANGALTWAERMRILSNGDFQLYEDTGVTPKLFWDASQEFLGLGTNSPLTPLYLQYANNSGTNYLDSDAGFIINNTGSNGSTIKMQTNANIIYGSGSNTLVVSDRQNERLRIDSSGQVGIGTNSPTAKIDVVSSSANLGRFTATNGYIEIIDPSVTGRLQGSGNVFTIGTTASGDMLAFKSGANTERMRLDTNGNLLVGKTNANATDAGIVLNSSGRLFAVVASDDAVFNRTTTDGSIISLRKDGATVGSIGSRSSGTALQIYTSNTGIDFGGDGILPMVGSTITDNSRDIGSSSYRFKDLYLSGGVYGNSNALKFSTNAGTTQHMTLDTSGNLLVGTTTVGTKSGDTVIGFGPNGGIISKQNTSVADDGTVDIAINTPGGGYQGFLIVSNTRSSSANYRTHTTFSVFGRGTDSSIQQIATDNGTSGGASFTVTTPSNGVIRVTNTHGETTSVNIQFFGGTSS